MKQSPLLDHFINVHGSVSPEFPGASSKRIADLRCQAIGQLKSVGLPRMRDEGWKYTNIRKIEKNSFAPTFSNGHSVDASVSSEFDVYRMVFVDGWFDSEQSTITDAPVGVVMTTLAQVLTDAPSSLPVQYSNQLLQCLDAQAQSAEHGFIALNTAFAADGAVIFLGDNAQLDKPIELLFLSSHSAEQVLCNTCNFLFAASGSSATIIERYLSSDATNHLTVSTFSAFVGDGSRLEHCRVQNESLQAFHVGSTHVNQSAHSEYRLHSHSLGASLSRHDVTQELNSEHSVCELNGLYIGNGTQHLDSFTNIVHSSCDAKSSEFYKGILDDRARAVFHGRIRVEQDAQRTDAHQQNRNLLLSRDAEADTKPQLEIYADDVKCAHGATVGELDENAIFYLQSRGLDQRHARSILTKAFASDIVDRIDSEPIREYVNNLVYDKLHHNIGVELNS